MAPKPIFDTNIFGDVQSGAIPHSDWRFLLRRRPGHGWPLSMVTALELLVGLHNLPPGRFVQHKKQLELAHHISKGRILEEPRSLLCKEVLRIPFPTDKVAPRADVLSRYIDVARRAHSLQDILDKRVRVGPGRAGFATSVLEDLVSDPKRKWIAAAESFANEIYPDWREHAEQTGKRLPESKRKELEPRSVWENAKPGYCRELAEWLGCTIEGPALTEYAKKLDAVCEFTSFVTREFLLRNYNLAKHESDVYDQFQLHYLAMDRFVIVSSDADLFTRTNGSSQAPRILSMQSFLQSL